MPAPHATSAPPSGAIIVSHGQPSNPAPAEATLADLAARVAMLMPDRTITSATLASPGALATAVARAGPTAQIYPLFMTDGWFTRTTLPKRLGNADADILPPLGTDPSLPDLARDWLTNVLATRGWQAADTCLIIAAHGSGKSRNAARDTTLFADAVAARLAFADIRTGYVEEPPFLADAARDVPAHALCLPFFAAAGDHIKRDLPDALDQAGFAGLRLPPIGLHADIPALIAAALHRP